MELKVGSWYRTRDGKRAVNIKKISTHNKVVVGTYFDEEENYVTSYWWIDGRFNPSRPSFVSAFDLVEEIDAKMLV